MITDTVKKCLDLLKVQIGATHTEIKLDPIRGPVIIETHTRTGGDFIAELVNWAYGIDVYKLAIQSYLGQDIDVKPLRSGAASINYFQVEPGQLVSLRCNDPELLKQAELIVLPTLGQKISPIKDSFSRCGFAICVDKSYELVREKMQKLIDSIQFQITRS